MVKTQVITGGANHAGVQNLRGWSIQGTVVLRLRKVDAVGDVIAVIENSGHELFGSILDAEGGTYVEVVSGALTEGYLWYV